VRYDDDEHRDALRFAILMALILTCWAMVRLGGTLW
jgi:hypothetical protein